jgi:hypothetical protein
MNLADLPFYLMVFSVVALLVMAYQVARHQ